MGRSAISTLAAALVLGCGPIGPVPGGRLSGEVQTGPVTDWSFTEAEHTIQVETRPQDPYSVNTWCAGYEEQLYVPTSLIRGAENPADRQWVKNVLEDPRVRLRIGGVIYERRAERVTNPTELEAVRGMLLRKYEVEASEDGRERRGWIFRMAAR